MDEFSQTYRAAGTGESIELRSGHVLLTFRRRTTGWGWAELTTDEEDHLAVLDHLGELAIRDSLVPMRLEASSVESGDDDLGAYLAFPLKSASTRDSLAGTSFDAWVGSPFVGPLLEGSLVVRAIGDGRFSLAWKLISTHDINVRYLRGPWVSVGRGSFGAVRDDAILPGIEWCDGDEWTSGYDWFRDPWAMRATPVVDSIAIPVMAVSHEGRYVALSWEAAAEATGWFSTRRQRLQPVLAAPDFIERRNASLLGLMIPETEGAGDAWEAERPLELHRGQEIVIDAILTVGVGTSLGAVVDHVAVAGLPNAPESAELAEAVHGIAATYADRLWSDGGFISGHVPGHVGDEIPDFVVEYLSVFPDRQEARRLNALVVGMDRAAGPDLAAVAATAIERQRDDGSFVFDPAGAHRSKDDFVVARDLVAPMGLAGDRALDLDVLPALDLLRAHRSLGGDRFADAARLALDAALVHRRPEGGDYWETPLHAPNLLAAGHAVVAYGSAWMIFGDERYRSAARYWLQSLLVFTHLWSPRGREMIYNTKPCLCSSDWYFANWVRDHVQWEVIETIALLGEFDVPLAALDDTLDWDRYSRGVLGAGTRWLLDHRDDSWRPHNLPHTLAAYREGAMDGCLPDTHNSITGLYGGMAIVPGRLGQAILSVLAQEKRRNKREREIPEPATADSGPMTASTDRRNDESERSSR